MAGREPRPEITSSCSCIPSRLTSALGRHALRPSSEEPVPAAGRLSHAPHVPFQRPPSRGSSSPPRAGCRPGAPEVGVPLCSALLSPPPSCRRLCEPFPLGAWSRGRDLPQGGGLVLSTEVLGPGHACSPWLPGLCRVTAWLLDHTWSFLTPQLSTGCFLAKNPYFLPNSPKPIPFLKFPLRLPLDLI